MKRLRLAAISILSVLLVACAPPPKTAAPGICGSGIATAAPPSTAAATKLETVQVAIIPIPDVAPAKLAEHCGYFAAEGLKIQWAPIHGASDAIPGLQNGNLHVSLWNYVTAYATEAAQPGLARLIADAYAATENTFLLMVRRDSPLQSLADLKWNGSGEKVTVGVATLKSVSTLTTERTLQVAGVSADDITFVKIPLPEMAAAVQNGRVDVGWFTEPSITYFKKEFNGRTLADVATGPTNQWPVAGWAVSAKWAAQRPDLVVRFQRALARGQELAALDDSTVKKILPTYANHIDAATASSITLGQFPITLNPTRLQRVGDAMLELSKGAKDPYLTKPIDAADLIWDPSLSASPTVSSSPGSTP
ncbi:ABC transporter substrate-binding protein [Nonomuraea sp. SYSU D8015]|uniref:ABC transporter substrate-binding protein n=1 Tax=Nonomuraea sp. SYSU D8015 TaxID=2593644 RepID=UPI001CB75351|nr:ABC transporter substrate-binding protein [Nonomuraea sp. SYSU D8015]